MGHQLQHGQDYTVWFQLELLGGRSGSIGNFPGCIKLFEMQAEVSLEEQGACLLAVGAALRSESLGA
ncbi:MAG: hypothetical protein CL797_09530 [Chromatiales bacterium]|jgi:hypothetical protein|nr:hypothetical protein [Chromatiales bacterium]